MFQESELVNLALALVALCILIPLRKREGCHPNAAYLVGFCFVVAALFFTVVEGVFWHSFFNVLEHLCYAASGLSFVFALRGEMREEAGEAPPL